MPRITIGNRLQSLVNNPNLTANEQSFAASLLAHYQKRNTLTKGRRVWLDKLETVAAEAQSRSGAGDAALILDIQDVLTRAQKSSWDHGFLESIQQQTQAGKSLSSRQLETFEKIKGANTPDVVGRRDEWAQTYQANHREIAKVVATYYLMSGYYLDMARNILKDAAYVPPMDTFTKMTENKYARKVIQAWKATPKYAAGSAVIARGNTKHAALRRGGVVISTNGPIISAAAGAKRYKVLPYGKAEPILCEERHIKLLRPISKKHS